MEEKCSWRRRSNYIAYAIFFGPLGGHDFYAGRIGPGLCKLVLLGIAIFCATRAPTVSPLIGLVLLAWIVADLRVKRDASGAQMR